MKRRALLLLLPWPLAAAAAAPEVTLLVELRWVDRALPAGAQAGVRDGAVVVGTAGGVSPQGAGTVTATAGAAAPPAQRLQVRNGERATLRLSRRERLQTVDPLVELGPQGQVRSIYARPTPGEPAPTVTQALSVLPSWPGGRAPVRVAFSLDEDGQAVASTLDLPLERWQTVARTGAAAAPAPRGTLRSTDAAGQPERELQLRVSLLPPP